MATIYKPFTIVHNVSTLGVVLQVADVLLHDRGGHGFLFLRDRRFRFHRLSLRSNDVCAAIAQASSTYTFVRSDHALKIILGLGWVERVCMRPTCLLPAVSADEAVTQPRTLAELAAGISEAGAHGVGRCLAATGG